MKQIEFIKKNWALISLCIFAMVLIGVIISKNNEIDKLKSKNRYCQSDLEEAKEEIENAEYKIRNLDYELYECQDELSNCKSRNSNLRNDLQNEKWNNSFNNW